MERGRLASGDASCLRKFGGLVRDGQTYEARQYHEYQRGSKSRIRSRRVRRRHPDTRPDGEGVWMDHGDRSGNGQHTVARQDGNPDGRGGHPDGGGPCVYRDLNGDLLALDATSGKILYRYDTKDAMAAGIITYRAGGTQYVAAAAGNTSFVAWKVTGKPTLFIFGL